MLAIIRSVFLLHGRNLLTLIMDCRRSFSQSCPAWVTIVGGESGKAEGGVESLISNHTITAEYMEVLVEKYRTSQYAFQWTNTVTLLGEISWPQPNVTLHLVSDLLQLPPASTPCLINVSLLRVQP